MGWGDLERVGWGEVGLSGDLLFAMSKEEEEEEGFYKLRPANKTHTDCRAVVVTQQV